MTDLAGKNVVIVHPAWHSCGTYSVVLGQIEAYRRLGAAVTTVACSDIPGFAPTRTWIWRDFVKQTPELDQQARLFAGMPFRRVIGPEFLLRSLWPFLHGDQAAMRAGASDGALIPASLAQAPIDLVHCNHFFCMPIARRIARGRPIVLDTHDVQAAQFDLINNGRPHIPPRTSYDTMLARELAEMRDASTLLHLNADEDQTFRGLLPDCAHRLLYPPVPDVPTGPGGPDILLVSSWNKANLESMLWFLREVMPFVGNPSVRIAGSVDAGVKSADADLYARHRDNFLGRVDDLGALYARARLVLLPTVAGTGLSIKTVEAMASGLPLLASPLAFRGMSFDPAVLRNVSIADTAEAFAQALRTAADQSRVPSPAERIASDTRRLYAATFSADAYAANLLEIVTPLLTA